MSGDPSRPEEAAARWREQFAARLMTPEEAIRLLRPGRRIFIGSGAAQPLSLVDALVRFGNHLADNEVVHILTLGPAPYTAPECADRFRHNAFFIGPNVRAAVRQGRADFTPVFLSELPSLLKSGRLAVDAALVQVSLPDADGYASLGVSVDVVRAAVDTARLVVAEVNPHMPRTRGDTRLDLRRCAALVPVDTPLLERPPPAPEAVDRVIGEQVADLIPDGATLQVGIGRAPSAILSALREHQDLGIHTEMLSDGIMELVRNGAITGRRKTLLPGKLVASFLMGSRALYAWADGNDLLEMAASDWVNDPQVIARNDRMVSINTALAVDLTGQVAADTLEGSFYSGIGGQVDFVRGAARSKGGRSLIVLPSLARDGTVSRIQAVLPEGSAVVTSRGDVRYLVTEYGVADLWGKSVRERALALVAIAHPDHRADLLARAKARAWVLPDQPVPRVPFETRQWVDDLPDGVQVRVRAARLTDERKVHELLYALSPESVYQRYFAQREVHPRAEVVALLDTDPRSSCALVAEKVDDGTLLGIARYDLDQTSGMGELGIVVAEAWQKRGVGTALVRRLVDVGKSHGVKGLRADVLVSNPGMIGVLRRVGLREVPLPDAGVYAVQFTFPKG
ncbi:MAG TPA: GNAT family N-acetyltransferase [Myxococcaceae bacterium]|nr:GNAT family N-acetyltransferase [Myxococcaceae bacterium]